eukprot:CAMPEP_0115396124 /NCGR_PEP_ID=MMETSP0271-20121206/13134_1 /TAXON_ID=71861 /ORGANISM="Scrippsiella trochoidea, Strain CCMP3099" /LENGTH=75 /DNA_ID=CAMNT_0002819845 /DNA_START=208 /DNA_END=435 /DNA_ORIENTATION=-
MFDNQFLRRAAAEHSRIAEVEQDNSGTEDPIGSACFQRFTQLGDLGTGPAIANIHILGSRSCVLFQFPMPRHPEE